MAIRVGSASVLVLIALTIVGETSSAMAQSRGSSPLLNSPSNQFRSRSQYGSRPAYSPYLNLLRPGNTALNYYGLVRPEQEFRSANQQFQQQFRDVDRKLESVPQQREGASNLGVTGHRTRFLTDQRGGAGSVTATLTDRDQQRQKLPPTPGSRIAPTGHSSYYNNAGTYYSFPGRP